MTVSSGASPAAAAGSDGHPPERLVQRLRRNNTTIKAHSSEGALLAESLNLKKEVNMQGVGSSAGCKLCRQGMRGSS